MCRASVLEGRVCAQALKLSMGKTQLGVLESQIASEFSDFNAVGAELSFKAVGFILKRVQLAPCLTTFKAKSLSFAK